MPGLNTFLQIAGALPFSSFLKGGSSTLPLPTLSSETTSTKRRRPETRRRPVQTRRRAGTRQRPVQTRRRAETRQRPVQTRRPIQTRRRAGTRRPVQTRRRAGTRRPVQTRRRAGTRRPVQTRRRASKNKVIEPRKLSQRKRVGTPGKYVCVNGCGKNEKGAYYTGKEPSPKGLGYCARCTPLNIVMRGNDGNLWENKKFSKGKRWVKV